MILRRLDAQVAAGGTAVRDLEADPMPRPPAVAALALKYGVQGAHGQAAAAMILRRLDAEVAAAGAAVCDLEADPSSRPPAVAALALKHGVQALTGRRPQP